MKHLIILFIFLHSLVTFSQEPERGTYSYPVKEKPGYPFGTGLKLKVKIVSGRNTPVFY